MPPWLPSMRDSSIFTIVWQQRQRWAGWRFTEGYPRTAVIYRLRAIPRDSTKITFKWLKSLDLNGLRVGVIWSAFVHVDVFSFLFACYVETLWYVRYSDNDSFPAYKRIFCSILLCCTAWRRHMPGTYVDHVTCNVRRTFPRYRWYLDVGVMLAHLREREIEMNMGQFTAKAPLIRILARPERKWSSNLVNWMIEVLLEVFSTGQCHYLCSKHVLISKHQW